VFNVSLLLFDVKQCDCCGQTIPFHDDPQLDRLARDKSHNFRRKHLHTQYHEAWFCDCDAICRGGQFYGVKKQKELDWFKAHHGFYPAEHFANDDSRKKLICVTCYNDFDQDGEFHTDCVLCFSPMSSNLLFHSNRPRSISRQFILCPKWLWTYPTTRVPRPGL
jgi:hypothetical protein